MGREHSVHSACAKGTSSISGREPVVAVVADELFSERELLQRGADGRRLFELEREIEEGLVRGRAELAARADDLRRRAAAAATTA
jgi:hypothetical protein